MDDGRKPVLVRCKKCGEECCRQVIPPYDFVHWNDWIEVGSLSVTPQYDHVPVPDVIDIEG